MNTMPAVSELLRKEVPAEFRCHAALDDETLAQGPSGSYWDPATDRVWHGDLVQHPLNLLEKGWLPIGDYTRAWHLVDAFQRSYKRDIEEQGIALLMDLKAVGPFAAVKLGMAIHRSSRELGKWQASTFDHRGFYTHTTHDSAILAVASALAHGFDQDGEHFMQEVFQQHSLQNAA
jgi:hypothetical protein